MSLLVRRACMRHAPISSTAFSDGSRLSSSFQQQPQVFGGLGQASSKPVSQAKDILPWTLSALHLPAGGAFGHGPMPSPLLTWTQS